MDIGHLRHLRWAKNNQQSDWVTYNRMRGQFSSALEHATPERFFVDPTTCNAPTATPTSTPPFDAAKPVCAEGISAVKAIAIAQSQGQKVYTLTSRNIATSMPQLNHSQATIDDVQNAVNAGKEVTISQARITLIGWTGAGYAVVDPATGAGSYLIEGKANGGNISAAALALGSLAFIMLLVGKLALVGLIPALAIAAPFYALVLGGIALTLFLIEIATGGLDRTCGGSAACGQIEIITRIAAVGVLLALLGAASGGSLVPLILAFLLYKSLIAGNA